MSGEEDLYTELMLDLQFRDKDKSSARNLTNQDVALMLDPLEESRDRPSMTHCRSANNHSNCAQIGASSSSSLACIENSSPLSSPSQLVNSTPPTVLEVVGATLSVSRNHDDIDSSSPASIPDIPLARS